jgi:hypothetical protein
MRSAIPGVVLVTLLLAQMHHPVIAPGVHEAGRSK